MTQEEILQYNKMCAEFLTIQEEIKNELVAYPLQEYSPLCSYANAAYICDKEDNPNNTVWDYCKFNSDWNWIIEVVEAIEKTYNEFHGYFGVFISSNGCTIQGTKLRTNPENPHYAYFNDVTHNTKKEAVVEAINQFLIWYK